jgi:hypothetical protein
VSGHTETESVGALVDADVEEVAVALRVLLLDLGHRVPVLKNKNCKTICQEKFVIIAHQYKIVTICFRVKE